MFFKDNRHKKIFLQKPLSPQQPGKIKKNTRTFPQINNNQQSNFDHNHVAASSHIHSYQIQPIQTPKIPSYIHKKTPSSRQKTSRYPHSQIVTDLRNFYSSSTSKKQLSNQKSSLQMDKISKNGTKIQVKLPHWQSRNEIILNQKQTERIPREKKKSNNCVQSCDKGTLMNFLKKIEENKKIIRNQIYNRKENDKRNREFPSNRIKQIQEKPKKNLQLEDVEFTNKMKEVKQALKSLKMKNQSTTSSTRIPSTLKLQSKKQKIYTQPSSSQQFQSTPIKQAYFKANKKRKEISTMQRNLIDSNLSMKQRQRQLDYDKDKHANFSFEQQLQRAHNFMQKGSSSLEKYVYLACSYHNPIARQKNVNSILEDRRQSYKRILNKSKIIC